MNRRTFFQAGLATLAMPALVAAQSQRVLRFIPQADLAVLDPMWTTAFVTRHHGYMVFDTLFEPQLGVAGLVVSFLAVLELVRERLVDLTQTAPFAPIYVKLADGVVER